MKDANRLPHPIKITFSSDGSVSVKRASWKEYDLANPKVKYRRAANGEIVRTPVISGAQ